MKFTAVLVGALAAVASALPAFTNTEFDVEEGKPFTLTWIGATGPVNIEILTGPNQDSLVPVRTIATGVTANSFTYVPSDLPSGSYAFKIVEPSTKEENYSVTFSYTGTASSSSLVSVTRSTSRTTSSATSSTSEASSTTSSESTSSTSSATSATSTPSNTRSSPPTIPSNSNEGQRFSSSLALVFITVAALVFFN